MSVALHHRHTADTGPGSNLRGRRTVAVGPVTLEHTSMGRYGKRVNVHHWTMYLPRFHAWLRFYPADRSASLELHLHARSTS